MTTRCWIGVVAFAPLAAWSPVGAAMPGAASGTVPTTAAPTAAAAAPDVRRLVPRPTLGSFSLQERCSLRREDVGAVRTRDRRGMRSRGTLAADFVGVYGGPVADTAAAPAAADRRAQLLA